MIQHFFQIDVIVVIQPEWVPDNVCHLHPGVDKHDLHNLNKPTEVKIVKCINHLKPGDCKKYDACIVLKVKVLGSKNSQKYPGIDGHHQGLSIDQR